MHERYLYNGTLEESRAIVGTKVCVHSEELAAAATDPRAQSDTKWHRAIIDFSVSHEDGHEETHTYTIESRCTNIKPQIGTSIIVEYDPDDPQKVVDNSFTKMFLPPIVCFWVGTCLPCLLALCRCYRGGKDGATSSDRSGTPRNSNDDDDDMTVDTADSEEEEDEEMQLPNDFINFENRISSILRIASILRQF